jgi:maltose O-acetyltransferase
MSALFPVDVAGELARALRSVSRDPASVGRMLDLGAGVLRARLVLRKAKLGGRVYAGSGVRAEIEGDVAIGDLVAFFGGKIGSELICHPGATLSIGRGCEFNYGVSIEARCRVIVGERCKFGALVRVADLGRGEPAPVEIGSDVWIAHGCVIEPGVTIGDGCVVSAGSVVTTSIPAGSLAIGNPARPVRLDLAGKAGSQQEERHA